MKEIGKKAKKKSSARGRLKEEKKGGNRKKKQEAHSELLGLLGKGDSTTTLGGEKTSTCRESGSVRREKGRTSRN